MSMVKLKDNGLTLMDCFCGAGVGAVGAEYAGFRTIFAFDNNKHAVRNYNKNLNTDAARVLDMKTLVFSDLPDVDVITGGFPCKPFSENGKRLGTSDPKNGNLAEKLLQLILYKQPKAFLIENVKGLINKKNKPFFDNIIEDLSHSFNVEWALIDCSEYGVAQKRERVFIVGIRKDLNLHYNFPVKTHEYSKVSIQEALAGLPSTPDNHNNHDFDTKWMLRNDEKPYAHLIPDGGCWKDLPTEDMKKAFMKGSYLSGGGKTTYLSVMDKTKPARTIMSTPMGKNNAQILNLGDGNIRRYTVRESLRLQSVPDWWGFDDETPRRIQYERCSGIPCLVSYKLMCSLANILTEGINENTNT